MAFSTGGRGPFQGQMNVTPLIDVLLVLIIVFMVVQIDDARRRGWRHRFRNLRRSMRTTRLRPRTIVLQVVWTGKDKQPLLRINQEDVSWAELQPRLNDIYKQRAEKVAFVKGDDDIDFEYVAQVIDVAHAAGVDRVALMARLSRPGSKTFEAQKTRTRFNLWRGF